MPFWMVRVLNARGMQFLSWYQRPLLGISVDIEELVDLLGRLNVIFAVALQLASRLASTAAFLFCWIMVCACIFGDGVLWRLREKA